MDVFAAIAAERRALADDLAGLTPDQASTASLCEEWTVHEVLGHLVVPLEVGVAGFALMMLRCGGSFDRANVRLARGRARRPFDELLEALRAGADHRFTPPGSGPEAPLTDVVVHGLDISRPLGLDRTLHPGRAAAVLDHLVSPAAKGLAVEGVGRVRCEATDLGWAHGDGPVVRGEAADLLLALTGRAGGAERLEGEGVGLLRPAA